jgi:Peptidase A4 family
MHKFAGLVAAAGAAVVVMGVSAGSAAASPAVSAGPAFPVLHSPIASGYAAVPMTNGAKSFTHVQVSFTVPAVVCPVPADGDIAQQRAGLDGISDNTIERVGISESCQAGAAPYTAWYQMYPAAAHVLFNPSPGDKVDLSVTFAGGVYTFTVDDVTKGKTYSATATCASVCHNSSAQVTAGSPAPLTPADFGTVHFKDIVVTDSAGKIGGLASTYWGTVKLVQTGSPRTVAGPLTTSLAPPASAFADHWKP